MSERRCDLHGPYSPTVAAAIVLGRFTPPKTGYLCPECRAFVKRSAQALADRIVEDAIRLWDINS